MRALHLIARDLADMAEMNKALAEDLLELSVFFGGAAALPAAAPPKASQPSPPLPQPVPRPAPPPAPQPAAAPPPAPVRPPVAVSGQAADPETETVTRRNGQVIVRRKAQKEPSRQLSQEEKQKIRQDWESLPPNLRTPTNRAAIAAKFQCSRAQVFALTRTDLHEHLMSANTAKLRKAEERQAARQG